MEEERSASLPPEPRYKCTTTCLRACLVANSIFMWAGAAFLFLLGVFAYNFLKRFYADGQGLKLAAEFPTVSIMLGIIIVLFALLTGYLLIFPTKIRYFTLSGVLASIFIVQFFYFITQVEFGGRVEKIIIKGFQTAMINYNDGFDFNVELNLIQWLLKCCGAKNYKDWFETTWADGKIQVPESCCINVKYCHNLAPVMVDDIYKKGCEEKLRKFIRTNSLFLIILIVFFIITQISGIVLTLILGVREINKIIPPRRRNALVF